LVPEQRAVLFLLSNALFIYVVTELALARQILALNDNDVDLAVRIAKLDEKVGLSAANQWPEEQLRGVWFL
jgi:hypothetical protein